MKNAWPLLVVGFLLLLGLGRRKAVAGAVQVRGTMSRVALAIERGRWLSIEGPISPPPLDKVPGGAVNVAVSGSLNTTNAAGTLIDWTYQLESSTTGTMLLNWQLLAARTLKADMIGGC